MANQTVYPYGQDGQLPSGYPIADDLETNSAQQALSAKQGTVIRPYIMDTMNVVDSTTLTEQNYSLGTTGWNVSGKHIVIPVTPGQTILLQEIQVNSYPGGFYAFFTSAYTPPTSASDTIPYANPSEGRLWFNSSTVDTKELVVPNNAAYLCLCTKDSGGRSNWKYSEVIAKSKLVNRTEIVDNLSSTKTDVPLSANQGRVLAEMWQSPIPAGLTKHDYVGPLVKVETHKVASQQVASITATTHQGGACYGDFLFLFTANNTTCYVYNLATNSLVQTITIPSEERGFVSSCHCNTVNFGTEKYDANDPFPLIYVSTGYASGGYTGALVYRIVATTESDVTTYSLSLVQTLKMPGTGWTEFVVGVDSNCYLCYTTTKTIYRMKMPRLSEGDITFDLEQALETYQFTPQPSWYNGSRNHNRLYYDGKIYMVSGVPSSSETSLFFALDLATQTRVAEIDLKNTLGHSAEPETVFIWNGHFCIVFNNNAKVVALYFE